MSLIWVDHIYHIYHDHHTLIWVDQLPHREGSPPISPPSFASFHFACLHGSGGKYHTAQNECISRHLISIFLFYFRKKHRGQSREGFFLLSSSLTNLTLLLISHKRKSCPILLNTIEVLCLCRRALLVLIWCNNVYCIAKISCSTQLYIWERGSVCVGGR